MSPDKLLYKCNDSWSGDKIYKTTRTKCKNSDKHLMAVNTSDVLGPKQIPYIGN